MKIYTSEEK